MKTKQKISLMLFTAMIIMFIGLFVNLTTNSRDFGLKAIDDKVFVVAESIKHGLTAHMVNDQMDKRDFFLNQIKTLSNVNDIWLVRSPLVVKQYGEGRIYEKARDKTDYEVINTGVALKNIDESIFGKNIYRITIPYNAEITPTVDCTSCHNAKPGQSLGAISMEIDISDLKSAGIQSTLINTIFGLVVIFLVLVFVHYIITPYINIFESMKNVMKKANQGDYSGQIPEIKNKEVADVANWTNALLGKVNGNLININQNIDLFLNNNNKESNDPLINVKNSVNRLAEIYNFKKTIELDRNLIDIYQRLESIFVDKLKINNFNIIEVDSTNKTTHIVYEHGTGLHCNVKDGTCRADFTHSKVDSSQFKCLCESRLESEYRYICLPYSINNDFNIIINIEIESKEEHERIRNLIPSINDYIETTKSEIVNKKLMEILERSALTDALTGLYNRKFLEDNVIQLMKQAKRTNIAYGILMCDIDYFKMINDNYGHDVGDEAIRVIANTIKENIRESDYAIRYGGEEFIVLLYNCGEEYVKEVAEKIRVSFSKKKIYAGSESFSKTLSIGCSIYSTQDESIWKCIKYADMALYEAKETGRNKVIMFSEELAKNKNIEENY